VQGIVPADACRLFGPERPPGKPGEPAGRAADPDGTGGYYQPGIVRAPGTGDTLFEVRVRCGLAGATQEQVAAFERTYRNNTNPALSDVVITRATGAASVPDGDEIVVAPGEELRVRASWPACPDDAAPCAGAERYPAFDRIARALVTRREAIRVSWLATRGHFADVRSGRDEEDLAQDVETIWTAPSGASAGAGAAAVVFVVVRDARGGTGLRSFRVRLGS
jgi:hypothetical protein